jgi:hypothetical protein
MANDPTFREWWASYLRMGPAIDACASKKGDSWRAWSDARFVELPGNDHLPFVGDQDAILREIEDFVGQSRTHSHSHRMLATVLCATCRSREGHRDATAIETVRALVASEAARFGGGPVQCDGNHVFTVFDGPARAIRCGCAVSAADQRSDAAIRVGLHTGECDLVAAVARGLVADIATRVAELARPGEVLVSRTVVDLVAGSHLHFIDRGSHRLAEGMDQWRVFAAQRDASDVRSPSDRPSSSIAAERSR